MSAIKDHWYRAETPSGTHLYAPCAHRGCGRPEGDHVEAVGEWMEPRHFFLPRLRSLSGLPRLLSCSRCDRRWGHSTHHGSRKNRELWWDRWNTFWDALKGRG